MQLSTGRISVPTQRIANYASGEYDRVMSEAIAAGEMDRFFEEVIANSGIQLGGARVQRGGNREELNRNVARIKAAIIGGPNQVFEELIHHAARFTGAAAEKLEVDGFRTTLGMLGGAGAAGYTVIFGVPEFPALTTALWSFVAMLPDKFLFALLQVLKAMGIAVSFVGAAGTVTLLCVGILASAVLVYRINTASWEIAGAAIGFGAKKLANFARGTKSAFGTFTAYLFGEAGVRPAPVPPAVAAAAEAAAAAVPVGGAGLSVIAYRVGVMVIRGPTAKQLAVRFSGGNLANIVVHMSDGTSRPAAAGNMTGGYRRKHKSRRKSRRNHRKSRRHH